MSQIFTHDVFLSYSTKDKTKVDEIARRLKEDGLRVWFDEWEIRPGDSIPQMVERGLEGSRVLVLCMSAAAFASDWAALESQTFRFRDPLNKQRRFIPLRLDGAEPKGSLAQFLYVDWRKKSMEAFKKLKAACKPTITDTVQNDGRQEGRIETKYVLIKSRLRLFPNSGFVSNVVFDASNRALTGFWDSTLRLWDVDSGICLREFHGHIGRVRSVTFSANGHRVLSGSADNTLRLWDAENGNCLKVLEDHTEAVTCVALHADTRRALSGSEDNTLRLWELENGHCLKLFEGHSAPVTSVALSMNTQQALSGSIDNTLRLWDLASGDCLRVLEGHAGAVTSVALNATKRRVLSGSEDNTLRLWDMNSGRCLRVLEGHTAAVTSVSLSATQQRILSGSEDKTLRLWDMNNGQCLSVLEGHSDRVRSVVFSANGRHASSATFDGELYVWALADPGPPLPEAPRTLEYINAKVLLVGDTSAGKTGLAQRLALGTWEKSDSTAGAWSTQWKLPQSRADESEREIWLWDFGGQADQRLIHQLYMDETALIVLVFDPQKENCLATLLQWDHELGKAAQRSFQKLLVAGRIDVGGLRLSRRSVVAFAKEHGFAKYLETSAKENEGCNELRIAIEQNIRWDEIPWHSSPVMFKKLKDAIVNLKDQGMLLVRFSELRQRLELGLGTDLRFKDDELQAVIGLLSGPGVVHDLHFGAFVLLQPERINAYGQALVRTLRSDEHELGSIREEKVLTGDLLYPADMLRPQKEEERIILHAMHKIFLERDLCLREHSEDGTLLIFPSYYRRERPDLGNHPAVFLTYQFVGFLDDVYATLVVRLHHTQAFVRAELWRYAADFNTHTGKRLGLKLTRRAEGSGELEVYFDPTIPVEEKVIFSRYIHEHLTQKARDVVRLRHYVCQHCGTPVEDRKTAMHRLKAGKKDIICQDCERRVPLWDALEEKFAAPEIQKQVRELRQHAQIVPDNESKERLLVGEVISTVALAGQIAREFSVSDHGIDMEIEFKSDDGHATGRRLYLQLKSGDSHLRERQRDDAEIFRIPKSQHASYWMKQAYPVMLVMRSSQGEIRWMNVSEYLKRKSLNGKRVVKDIEFEGERFDVMSVRRWRETQLG